MNIVFINDGISHSSHWKPPLVWQRLGVVQRMLAISLVQESCSIFKSYACIRIIPGLGIKWAAFILAYQPHHNELHLQCDFWAALLVLLFS